MVASRSIISILLLTFYILLFLRKDVNAASNCTATLCDMRYELAAEVHALLNYKTCDDVYPKDCICNSTIDIQFMEHPPYIYTDAKSGKVVGLLTGKKYFQIFFVVFYGYPTNAISIFIQI